MLSYNSNWWQKEQEIRGADNWEDLSRNKPWYRSITKNNLAVDDQSGIYYQEFGTSADMIQQIWSFYLALGYEVEHRVSSHCGYLPQPCFSVMPYNGQWGKGWLVACHDISSRSTVALHYLLIKKGVGSDGKQAADNNQ